MARVAAPGPVGLADEAPVGGEGSARAGSWVRTPGPKHRLSEVL